MSTKIHRFYIGEEIKLKQDFWLHTPELIWQWNKVLRFREGQNLVLFDGIKTDRLYKLERLKPNEAHLVLVTELERKIPSRHTVIFWSLLKRDNNELIIQKGTELGVSTFVPLITDRTIKKDFNTERARKIIIEASEQCGRSDIPHVRDPIHLKKALEEYKDKIKIYICHQGEKTDKLTDQKVGFVIGPEGGWSDDELAYFSVNNFDHVSLSELTLRAETAVIIASSL